VVFEARLGIKGHLTIFVIAFIGPIFGMAVHMDLKSRFLGKAFLANTAEVSFEAVILGKVLLDLSFGLKCSVTRSEAADKWI